MAKTRSRAKKSARPSAAKGGKKRREKPGLDLKKLRKDLDLAVAGLSKRAAKEAAPPPVVMRAQELMARWSSEIDELCNAEEPELCGPTMFLPRS